MQKQLFKRNKVFFATLLAVPFLAVTIQASAVENWFTKDNTANQELFSNFSGEHARFVRSVLSNTDQVNQAILQDRERLLSLQAQYEQTQQISAGANDWLTKLANEYKLDNFTITNKANWNELISRVDIIPASLVLAQAIQESGWGTSRLARDSNNFFGQECFQHGCGVSARHTHYSTYDDMGDAISTYIHNLNSNRAYQAMRRIRLSERQQHQKINSLALVDGMTAYSELRGRYIASIKSLVFKFKLQQFDKFVT
jgi:Bax protein